ncbi:NADPH-dependent FMN reductase [Allokutzneria albata]|uniref:NAD(P)H-dependent FMN reductase n=1 Tax=Allokutzneria albata TaxID=211114 RepID=A0A1G9SL81_ALLAB|nr:NAD(P)H-dependent oxidoreductase [Allokutzneria albata]SDM36181.1 NAD(P)H-dependent FMN reductase [Allokutzneria albata]
MSTTFSLLGISGSLRAASFSTAVLRAAIDVAPADTDLTLWRDLAGVPPFNEDHEDDPGPAVTAMRESITAADALVIATPEYNTSIPGQLKNALDWASRPYGESVLVGKPVAVIGVSTSDYGADWSQQALRKVLAVSGAEVLETRLCVPRADALVDGDGRLTDTETTGRLRDLVVDLRGLLRHETKAA